MTLHSRLVHVRRLTVTAVIAAVLSAVAVPAFADTPPATPAPSAAFSSASIAKAVAPATAPATAPAKAPQPSEGFFKSRTGMIVLAVFAVGTGYAIYSAKDDRIRGLNR